MPLSKKKIMDRVAVAKHLARKYHLSNKTAWELAEHGEDARVYFPLESTTPTGFNHMKLRTMSSACRLDCDRLCYQFYMDVRKTRKFVKTMRICAIIALRRSKMLKDLAVFIVKNHTEFWDDMDPIKSK